MNNEILEFIKNIKTWFSIEESSEKIIRLSTYEHGDMNEEVASPIDFQEAYRIRKLVNEKFKLGEDYKDSDVYSIDEYVILDINF